MKRDDLILFWLFKIAELIHLPFKFQPRLLKRIEEAAIKKIASKQQVSRPWPTYRVLALFFLFSFRGRIHEAQQAVRLLSPLNRLDGDRANIEHVLGFSPASARTKHRRLLTAAREAKSNNLAPKNIFATSYSLREIVASDRFPLYRLDSKSNSVAGRVITFDDLDELTDCLVLVPEQPIMDVESLPTQSEVANMLHDFNIDLRADSREISVVEGYQIWQPSRLSVLLEDAKEYSGRDTWLDSVHKNYVVNHGHAMRIGLVGRYGNKLFGGVEHFTELLESTYSDLGYVATVFGGASGSETSKALRKWVLENDIDLLHVFSGMGAVALEATEGLTTRVIYGIHFWREVLGNDDGRYFDEKENPLGNDRFYEFLNRFDVVYANSQHSSNVIEAAYGVRLPILPTAIGQIEVAPSGGKIERSRDNTKRVLVPNLSKSGDFAAQIAELMPDYRFIFLDSQPGEIYGTLPPNGLLRPKVADFAGFVSEFDAVLLPFFSVPETYSRVAAECQLGGVPLLCADLGNLRNMTHPELVLGKDVNLWANALRRVCEDHSFRLVVVEQIERLAASVPTHEELKSGLRHVLAKLGRARGLVGVGSGLGNMLHTTPALRSLGKKYSLDVMVNADHPGSLFLLQNIEHTRYVFKKGVERFVKNYDVVVVSHSWGKADVEGTHAVSKTRSKFFFRPSDGIHESIFNWESLSSFFNLASDEDFDPEYYVGEKRWRTEAPDKNSKTIVGVHAGSKGGHWETKRWADYDKLGNFYGTKFEFRCFGIPSEKVPNMVDMTGGSLEEMCDSITGCDFFVGNDSGVTHLAYALGMPTVFIFGPTARPSRGPSSLFGMSRVVVPKTECYPCEVKRPDVFVQGRCQCILAIQASEVAQALNEMINDEHQS